MRTIRRAAVIMAVIIGTVATAAAQSPGDLGLTVGYPSSIAVEWHISDRIALRPELSLSWTKTESPGGIEGDIVNSGWQTGVGASVLVYVGRWEALKTYVSPRYVYSRREVTVDLPFVGEREITTTGWALTGSFGGQYRLGDRFSVFGEAGLEYARTSGSVPLLDGVGETRARTFGTRTAAGVTIYF